MFSPRPANSSATRRPKAGEVDTPVDLLRVCSRLSTPPSKPSRTGSSDAGRFPA
jgi:hypothetical protein